MPSGYIGAYVIPSGIQSIGNGAFYYCRRLTSVTIPEGVISIGASAFSECSSLASVAIPKSVEVIGRYAFDCEESFHEMVVYYFGDISQWNSIEFGEEWSYCTKWYFYVDNNEVTDLLFPNDVTSIGKFAFYYCCGLKSITIPNSVTSIGNSAFASCLGLMSVVIPEGLTSIGERAFSNCYSLMSVIIPEGVTSIGVGAFSYCEGMMSVNLPKSLGIIGAGVWAGCDNLISVTSKAMTPPRIWGYRYKDGEYAFEEMEEQYEEDWFNYPVILYVPRGGKSAYQSALGWRLFKNIEELDTIYTVTVRANDETMGIVMGGGEYELDAQATLVAIPNPGYYFVRWDDGKTANPRILTVTEDMTLTAIFAKNGDTPPTANESALSAAPIAYVQGRTAYLADGLGEVEAFTATGQRVYRGTDRTVTLPRPGIYVLRVVADGRRCKVVVK